MHATAYVADGGEAATPVNADSATEVTRYLATDPVSNLFMLSWLDNYGIAPPARRDLFAFRTLRDASGAVDAVSLLIARRLVLIDSTAAARGAALGRLHADLPEPLEHVVSRRHSVTPFWSAYAERNGAHARLVRDQELYCLTREDWLAEHPTRSRQTSVRRAASEHLDAVFWASARMHAEETLEDPLERDAEHFRRHVAHRIENGRTYAWFDDHRRLLFKADISAQSRWGVQISGVYTPAALRGRGLASAAMADICEDLFARGFPRITLYVNRTNGAARHVYRKVGFRYHTDYETIFVARRW